MLKGYFLKEYSYISFCYEYADRPPVMCLSLCYQGCLEILQLIGDNIELLYFHDVSSIIIPDFESVFLVEFL